MGCAYMKLILAIINTADMGVVTKNLSKRGFFHTKLSSSGGLMKSGNVTILSAVEDEKVEDIIAVYREFSKSRTKVVTPAVDYSDFFTAGRPVEVSVGGATIMVLDIDQFIKI